MRPPARSTGPAFGRRSFLTAAAAAGLGAAGVAGCGTGEPDAATVRYWSLLSGGDGALMDEIIAEVRTQGIDLEPVVLAWGAPYYTKLAMASAGGRAPELAVLHLSRLAGYAPGGLLDPWDMDALADLGVTEDDFPPAVWERAQIDGERFAIPLDTHPFVLFYNTEHCEEAGLLESDGTLTEISSFDDWLAAGTELQKVAGGHGISYGYVNDGAQMWRLFATFYFQHGAEMTLRPGEPSGIDRDVAGDSLDAMKQMLDGTVANPDADYLAGLAEFTGGRSGFFCSGVWELRGMQAAGVPVDGTVIPTLFGTPATYADSHSYVLPHQDSPDPARRQATHEAVAAILKDSLRWAEAGHIPAYQPIVDSPEYAELTPQAHYAVAADQVVLDPEAWFTGSGSEFQTRVGQAMQTTLNGGASVQQALADVEAEVQRLLDQPNPA
ncbi:extracellular solute-binding protein [Angustibacter speluncae]